MTFYRFKQALEQIAESSSDQWAKATATEALRRRGRVQRVQAGGRFVSGKPAALCKQCGEHPPGFAEKPQSYFCSEACRAAYTKSLDIRKFGPGTVSGDRALKALSMRESGMTYRAIGQALGGVTPTMACALVSRGRRRQPVGAAVEGVTNGRL